MRRRLLERLVDWLSAMVEDARAWNRGRRAFNRALNAELDRLREERRR